MTVDCPSCHRDFETEQAMNIHHTAIHGESLAKVECVCERCGKEFERWRSQVEGKEELYCSKECLDGDQRRREDCANCGETIERYPSEFENSDRYFCSRACKHDYGRVAKECERCGTEFKRPEHRAERYTTEYCSRDCYLAEKEEGGENAPGWIDGRFSDPDYYTRYNQTFLENKDRALERDGYECHICGETSEEHNEEYGTELHVHHITPIAEIDDMAAAHELDNLVTLCLPCHRQWEGVPLKPQVVA